LSRQRGPTFKFSFGLQQQDSICREAIDAFVRLPFGRLFLSNKKNVNILKTIVGFLIVIPYA
jgi:hypothetical protein